LQAPLFGTCGQEAEFAPTEAQLVPTVVAQWFGNALQSVLAAQAPLLTPALF
jgi:hypothetical protein